MMKKSMFAAAVCAAAIASVGASAASAGEITGKGDRTAAPEHANSFCAYSGQNDLNPDQGQTDRRTQTPKDGPAGAPGHGIPGTEFENGCRGGSNPENPPS
jgi:uncharacterized membrane protein